jgi:lipopolysaccharide export system permease protein
VKILPRYIFREHIAPFFLSLTVVTFVLLADRAIDLINLIIDKRLDAATIFRLFMLSLPYMLALAIPMAVLVATILAFGRMSVDREITAMKSSGINIYKTMWILILVAALMSLGMVWFNHFFLPNTNHKLKKLTLKIAYHKPMTIIKEKEFTTLGDYTIYTKKNTENELQGILIYDRSQTRTPRLISAEKGSLRQLDGGNVIQVTLTNGEMHEQDEREPQKYQVRKFESFSIHIRDLAPGMEFADMGFRSDREMTHPQLLEGIREKETELEQGKKEIEALQARLEKLEALPDPHEKDVEQRRLGIMKGAAEDQLQYSLESLRSLQVEYHKKFALSAAILIFVLLGAPLGLMTRSSGIGMAFSVSSFIFLVYYVALTGGEELADRAMMAPFWAMWLTNIVFAILAMILIHLSLREKQLVNLKLLSWRLSHRQVKGKSMPDELIH